MQLICVAVCLRIKLGWAKTLDHVDVVGTESLNDFFTPKVIRDSGSKMVHNLAVVYNASVVSKPVFSCYFGLQSSRNSLRKRKSSRPIAACFKRMPHA